MRLPVAQPDALQPHSTPPESGASAGKRELGIAGGHLALIAHTLDAAPDGDGVLAICLLGATLLQSLLGDGDPGAVRMVYIGAYRLDVAIGVRLRQPGCLQR